MGFDGSARLADGGLAVADPAVRAPRSLSMPNPIIAQKSPYVLKAKAGTYWWCTCGASKGQPFCDGSHKGTEFSPVEYKAAESGTVYFCGCKHSAQGALCDGSHKGL